ncbi:hypothetical protein MMC26_002432 [Xylographa opegraphella]|nr:hypothetical protein [Xylographa opegraphella]
MILRQSFHSWRPSAHLTLSRTPTRFLPNIRKLNSTLSAPPPSDPSAAQQTPFPAATAHIQPASPQPRPTTTRYRTLIYSALFILLGLTTGSYVRVLLVPPPLPLPSTPADLAALSTLNSTFSSLPIVRELRSHPEGWVERAPAPSALTTNSMAGSRGLGVYRVFWNAKERRGITVVYFGGALAGWPGVTHGGAIATVLQEGLEMVGEGKAEMMQVRYLKPTLARRWYVLRAELDEAEEERNGVGELAVKATLETADEGMVCAKAMARCVQGRVPEKAVKSGKESEGLWGRWYKGIQNAFS